ncbi:MAG: sortase domain-containing protein, partial [Acidimicrobiales bacterium]
MRPFEYNRPRGRSREDRRRRALTIGGSILVVAALVMIGYPVATDLIHNDIQGRLSSQLQSAKTKQAYLSGSVGDGDSLTRIQIPKLGVDVVVVQGIDEAALNAGAGHYPETPLPCQAGDVAIAGHRTTFGKPFANINLLVPGDQINLVTPVGSCVYRVTEAPFIVLAD